MIALALIALCSLARTVFAQTVITSLPYTITISGKYVLTSDLASLWAFDAAIRIAASNVTLDFQDHYITGEIGTWASSNLGIQADNQANITIKNGTITGFHRGVELIGTAGSSSNSNNVVDSMRVSFIEVGVLVSSGRSCRIENCQVSTTATTFGGAYIGILVQGDDVSATLVRNSQVSMGLGGSWAIWARGTANAFIVGNQVQNSLYGVEGGKYQNNLTYNCMHPFVGGINAGGNN